MREGAKVLALVACLTCAPPPGARVAPVPRPVVIGQLGTNSAHLPALGVSPGLLDTLIAIAGGPRSVTVATMPDTLLGSYYNREDSIVLSSIVPAAPRHSPAAAANSTTRISPDWVISHEFGHRYDFHRRHKPCRRRAKRTAQATAENFYANRSDQEGFAEAFANAIDYLRYTAALGRHDTGSIIQRELFVPGTFDVVQELLRHRIYRDHPLADQTNRRK